MLSSSLVIRRLRGRLGVGQSHNRQAPVSRLTSNWPKRKLITETE